ncbi:zinc transport system ATP-binding protein [Alkalithermobacter thermoalcaliphilus JW-YL-7 = DSM 7308]|uniref:Polyamine-transporting ATPase n=1 Tax=Alkalithermobacter thermoalcaliphilus JW-YL-7 = DSM 7308 TaxID=1121328 RepID=A0A150FRU7_CLOPD|nr:Polyamine-transporting ATPase [[Clostridium] paradoxum JW-YL-7 = DSM 7308]SHK38438.1 zinc transport system ATP-binding protein [[Clostridium] paradoxum JW-YL-7 = DSM 7308]
MKSIFQVRNLSFSYDGVSVIDNISFDIEKGDYFALIGPNGSGKTTLLKLLLGILTPTSGKIMYLGEDIKFSKYKNKIGYVSQKANSFNESFPATVEEIILFTLKSIHNLSSKQLIEKTHEVLNKVNMIEYKDRLIGNLSGGQQQRVFIAKALSKDPSILFLDEPTVGVDYRSEEEFYNIMQNLNKEGVTIFIVSHDIGSVINKVNKVACIGNKKIHIHKSTQFVDIENNLRSIYGENIDFFNRN